MKQLDELIDRRETQKKKNRQKRTRGIKALAKGWGFSDFVVRLICKSYLELALSIILKEKELYDSKHIAMDCRCLKIWDLLSSFICSSILVLKWQQVLSI